jgi:hypothetical protein
MDKASKLTLEKLLQCLQLCHGEYYLAHFAFAWKNYLRECRRRRRERQALKFPS